MSTSGVHISEFIGVATCDTCGWQGLADITVDYEMPASCRPQFFTCPFGHENEQDIQ